MKLALIITSYYTSSRREHIKLLMLSFIIVGIPIYQSPAAEK